MDAVILPVSDCGTNVLVGVASDLFPSRARVHTHRDADDRRAFLEELIVRRELSMNFINTVENYDRFDAVPDWARRTLAKHGSDRRSHVYGYDRLAQAETHDPHWNAAMREMLVTGYMHNHMRMYWGKKVLEWSSSPEEGYETLLRLNDTYFIDGRDAN